MRSVYIFSVRCVYACSQLYLASLAHTTSSCCCIKINKRWYRVLVDWHALSTPPFWVNKCGFYLMAKKHMVWVGRRGMRGDGKIGENLYAERQCWLMNALCILTSHWFSLVFFWRLLLLLCLLERNRSIHPDMLTWITVSHFVTSSSYEAFKSLVSKWECFEGEKSCTFQPRD